MDRAYLLKTLQKHYRTEDNAKLIKKIRSDLKNKESIDKLLNVTGFEIKNLVVQLSVVFDGLFNKKLINKMRQELGIDERPPDA